MSAGEPLTIVYYVSGHGFGHATRVVEVTRHLIAAGHTVHVVTGAPHSIWTAEIDSPRLHFRKVLLDSGAVQSDALTVDRMGSLLAFETLAELSVDDQHVRRHVLVVAVLEFDVAWPARFRQEQRHL